jgi:multiple sugar transport system substrate-binding protein
MKRTLSLLSLLIVLAALLAACGSAPAAPAANEAQTTASNAPPSEAAASVSTESSEAAEASEAPAPSAEASEAPPTPTPINVSTFDQAAAGDRTVVRWFVGLGAGTQPEQIEAQQEFVEKYNASQDEIYLALDIVGNETAYEVLATQIAAGNAPDIIGPVGYRGISSFQDQILDLSDLIEKNNVDLSEYDESLVTFYQTEEQAQLGLPFAVYPSFIFYNKDLFDEADLPYPPHAFGEQYDGKPWDMNTLRELALKLTVDDQGADATEADFNPDKIVQFGFVPQWGEDPRAQGTLFGAASIVGEDGKAQIPDNWLAGWKWFHDGMFSEERFIPNQAYLDSELLTGNPFNTGNVAMAYTHLWYTCCIDQVKNWDIAVVPSYDGTTTAKLHADTFSILKTTKDQDAAFSVLQTMINDEDLLQLYGAFPAKKDLQQQFIDGLNEKFAGTTVDWQVALDSLEYVDTPNHEAAMPNFREAADAIQAFGTLYRSQADVDIDAEAQKLKAELDTIFAKE